MAKLYTSLAGIYDEMYTKIYDYDREFSFYHKWLKRYKAKSVLEIGCGTGRLLEKLHKAGYKVEGLDNSIHMLAIASKRAPVILHQEDMRNIRIRKKFDAALITGRSFTYMTTNEDVLSALRSVRDILKKGGVLIFDNFYAPTILGDFKGDWIQDVKVKGKRYLRENESRLNLKTGITWDWTATYKVFEGKRLLENVRDKTVLRAFFLDELKAFLEMSGFSLERHFRKEGASDFFVIARAA